MANPPGPNTFSASSGFPTGPHRYAMGLIGNCNFAALITTHANIAWLCWPRFDSSFLFGPLLDDEKGGEFSIQPHTCEFRTQQHYIENTNILTTLFETTEGSFEVIDFAPRFRLNERFHKPLMLFRKIRKISGHPRIAIRCRPRGAYGEIVPESSRGSHHIRYHGLPEALRLTTNASLTYIQQEREFALSEDLYLVLSWGVPLEGPLVETFEDFYTRTHKYWRTWVERCTLPRVFQKQVIRSALTLKLHQFEDTGAIIASCTTSLPEIRGEGRNWDYRFCWLRDTYYTLSALTSLGHFEEMERYSQFVENLNMEGVANLQPVYRIDGTPEMDEQQLPLRGYLGEQPVRVGNQAANQVQNDAYGQILLVLFNLYNDQRLLDQPNRLSPQVLNSLLTYVEKTLEKPDNGVWEFRGRRAIHTYTLLFQWAGSIACRKIAQRIGNPQLSERAAHCTQRAAALIEQAYVPELQAYAQAIGSRDLDASMLQMITLGYLRTQDRGKAVAHLRAIEKELQIHPGFFLRYRHPDDFGRQQSAFLVCSFWHIEALAQLDFIDEAIALLEHVTQAQNHLGLMAEDFDVETQSQWGNFPQTYSHVGLINSAFAIDKALRAPAYLLETP